MILLPIISSIRVNGGANVTALAMTEMLQGNNLASSSDSSYGCEYLRSATFAWLQAMALEGKTSAYLLWAQILPVRCGFQGEDGVVTAAVCSSSLYFENRSATTKKLCDVWSSGSTPASFASKLGIRTGEILNVVFNDTMQDSSFVVKTMFNESYTVERK